MWAYGVENKLHGCFDLVAAEVINFTIMTACIMLNKIFESPAFTEIYSRCKEDIFCMLSITIPKS